MKIRRLSARSDRCDNLRTRTRTRTRTLPPVPRRTQLHGAATNGVSFATGGAPLTEGHKEDHMELHIKGKVVSIHDKMEVLDEND